MDTPTYVVLSRQTGLMRQMDVLANNVANASTPGYKQLNMQFSEYLAATEPQEYLSMTQDRAAVRDFSEGPLTPTGNPFDVAIQGPGFFPVQTNDGVRYTRAGRFMLNSDRQIVDVDGHPLLDTNNNPMTLPPGVADVSIGADGTISFSNEANGTTDVGTVGKIGLATFAREDQLEAVGNGLYRTTQAPQPATGTKLAQGMVEESNVQPIIAITQITEVLRQYEGNQNLIAAEDSREKGAIQKLGRVSGS